MLTLRCIVPVALLLAVPLHALADQPAATAARAPDVGELFDRAQAAFAKGDLDGAYNAYRTAWALQKSFDIAGNLGNVELKLGRFREAASHLDYAVKNFPPTGDPGQQRVLSKKFEEARREVAWIRVRVNVDSATIRVNGQEESEGLLNSGIYVQPGDVTVEALLQGYRSARQTVRVTKGGFADVSLTLNPVQVSARRSIVPGVIVGGLAVGAAGTGIGLLVASGAKRDDALTLDKSIVQAHQRCVGSGSIDARCAKLDSVARTVDTLHDVAIGAFVGAGVLAAGAVTYFVWPTPKAQQTGVVKAAPLIGFGHGGMMVEGIF